MPFTNRIISSQDFRRLIPAIEQARASWSTYAPYLDHFHTQLRRARVATPQQIPDDVVTMNSRVELSRGPSEEPSDSATCTLVYPEEERAGDGRVSVLTPLGAALLGARVGEEVYWPSTDGPRTAKVRQLIYQPEAAGHLTL